MSRAARYRGFRSSTPTNDGGSPEDIARPIPPLGKSGAAPVQRFDEPQQPSRQGGRTPFADLLPTFQPVSGWFTAITVAAPAIAAGNSAWYGLRRVKVQTNNDQELLINGIEAEALPADVDGTGGSGSMAWGSASGLRAALVVGVDLPIQPGAWTSAPAAIAGIETSGTYLNSSQVEDSRIIWFASLPTGKFTDTAPQKWHIVKSWGAFTKRVTAGRSLDIALVVNRTAVNGLSGTIYGFGSVTVSAGLTETQDAFSR